MPPIQALTSVPVLFRPEMVALDASPASPSAGKPGEVVADWLSRGLPIDVQGFEPLDAATLALAHDRAYVEGVLSLQRPNGFGNRRPQVAASLPFTNGSMLAAARVALANGRVACSPSAGFHHAGYDEGSGYCTFNGLVVTAMALQREGRVRRVGILDLDLHWGDGTHDIQQRLGLSWLQHHSPCNGPEQPRPAQAEGYLARLPRIVSTFHDCDVLLYQAGADAHIGDPYGGWMSSEQLERRDRTVFEVAAHLGLPVVWNLAGGYQRTDEGGIEPVLDVHRRTMRACAEVYAGLLSASCRRVSERLI